MIQNPPSEKKISPSPENEKDPQQLPTMPVSRPIMTSPIIMGELNLPSSETQTTVGAAGAASALPANPTGYLKVVINGTEVVMPYYAQS